MAADPAADPPLGGSPARAHQDNPPTTSTNTSRTVSPAPTQSLPIRTKKSSNPEHASTLDGPNDKRTGQEAPPPSNNPPASVHTHSNSSDDKPAISKAFEQLNQHEDIVAARPASSNNEPKQKSQASRRKKLKPATKPKMSSTQPSASATKDAKTDPSSTDYVANIRALNALKAEVPAALRSAGLAVNALTDRPLQASSADETDPAPRSNDMEARKANYQAHTADFYTCIKTLSEGLNKSLQGLVEAGIVKDTVEGQGGEEKGVSNGGLGDLDVGSLNARAKDVGTGKAAELLKEVRARLEKAKREREEAKKNGDGEGGEEHDKDKMME